MLYLVATSGHPNYGDELVTAAWLRFLARARPEAEVWLDCPNPGLASFLFRDLHPRLRTTDVLWRAVWETTGMDAQAATDHVDRLLTELGTPRFDLGLLEARRATVVHLLGGGYVNAKWPTHVRLLRAALRLRDLAGARIFATGHGLTPAAEAATVRAYLDEFDHASVRDPASAELAGVDLVCDDALLGLPELPGYRDGTYAAAVAEGDVWVCLQNDMASPEAFESAVQAVRSALESPGIVGRPVHYLEALPGVDRFAFDRLSDLIPEENFVPFVDLWHGSFPARAGQTWITSRYHLHLLAAASGAEGTALQMDDAFAEQHRSLVEAGTGWSVTPPGSDTVERPGSARSFRSDVLALHEAKTAEAASLYPVVAPEVAAPPTVVARGGSGRAAGWRRRS